MTISLSPWTMLRATQHRGSVFMQTDKLEHTHSDVWLGRLYIIHISNKNKIYRGWRDTP